VSGTDETLGPIDRSRDHVVLAAARRLMADGRSVAVLTSTAELIAIPPVDPALRLTDFSHMPASQIERMRLGGALLAISVAGLAADRDEHRDQLIALQQDRDQLKIGLAAAKRRERQRRQEIAALITALAMLALAVAVLCLVVGAIALGWLPISR
jgi:hypothetical protein